MHPRPPSSVLFPGQPVAAVFASGNSTVLIADTLANQILQTGSLGSAPVWTPLALIIFHGVCQADPAGLALSTGQQTSFPHSRSGRRTSFAYLTPVQRCSGLRSYRQTNCAAQSLAAFAPGLFLLGSNNLSAGTVRVSRNPRLPPRRSVRSEGRVTVRFLDRAGAERCIFRPALRAIQHHRSTERTGVEHRQRGRQASH